MKALYTQEVSKIEAFGAKGMYVETVTSLRKPRDIIRGVLSGVLSKDILDKISESVRAVIYSDRRKTNVWIFSDREFEKFRSLAVKSNSSSKEGTEKFMMGNILWTTHDDFSLADVGMYTSDGKRSETLLSDKEIYSVRLVHMESSGGKETKTDDVIIYIPGKYITA